MSNVPGDARRARRRCRALVALVLLLAATLPAASAFAQPAILNLSGLEAGAQNDRFIIKYKASANVATKAAAQSKLDVRLMLGHPAGATGFPASMRATVVRPLPEGAFLLRSNLPLDRTQAENLLRLLATDAEVEYVEPDAIVTTLVAVNDRYYSTQNNLWGDYGIGGHLAWGMASGQGVVVAVIDTGITPHPDLDAQLLPGYDFVDRDADPRQLGCDGGGSHGTKVAGTIAAVTNNRRGVAGVAPSVRIVPVRVLGGCNSGGRISDIVEGIGWASGGPTLEVPANPNPAEVLNLSLGGPGTACFGSMQAVIDGAVKRGATVVVAAGNDGQSADKMLPASCANVITVGGSDDSGRRDAMSSHGSAVDIAAPIVTMWSQADDSATVQMKGTSASAPQVSGIVALMQSVAKTPLTPAKIEMVLKATAKPFASAQQPTLGAGIANAPAAVTVAQTFDRPTLNGRYTMVTRARHGTNKYEGCLALDQNGAASWYRRTQAGGTWRYCGHENPSAVVGDSMATWDIYPVTAGNGVTAHVIKNAKTGACLIRGHNGTARDATMYLWSDAATNRFCGFPTADAFIANGQAAWYLDSQTTRNVGGFPIVVAGLKVLRNFGFLGFEAWMSQPSRNEFREHYDWEFEFHPVGPPIPDVDPEPTGTYTSATNGQCLDIEGGVRDGAKLITWPCHGKVNQRFVVEGHQIMVGGRCLDAGGGRPHHMASVFAMPCSGAASQQWRIENGRIRNLMVEGAYCLDLMIERGNQVGTWLCHATSSDQRFDFKAG